MAHASSHRVAYTSHVRWLELCHAVGVAEWHADMLHHVYVCVCMSTCACMCFADRVRPTLHAVSLCVRSCVIVYVCPSFVYLQGAVQAASRGWRTPYTPISQYTAQPASGSTAPAQSVPASLLESAVPGPDVLLSTDLLSPKPMRGFLSLAYGYVNLQTGTRDHTPCTDNMHAGNICSYTSVRQL